MSNPFFRFKQFTINHDRCAMKVTTDACLFGAWVADHLFHQNRPPETHLLDAGTGSGLLSMMVAQKTIAAIDAVEIEPSAAGQATENAWASPWKQQIRVIETDLLQWNPQDRYDCIFSNPPFYENDLQAVTGEKNLARHGAGLNLQSLVIYIDKQLNDEGCFYLLLPPKREVELAALLRSNNLYLHQKVMVQQTPDHPPFRMMIRGCRNKIQVVNEQTIIIKHREGNYTSDFTCLLKDYYLYL